MLEYRYGKYGVQVKVGANFSDSRFPSDFKLVGSNDKASNEFCNVFSRNFGCLDGHNHVGKRVPVGFKGVLPLDGVIGVDKAVIHVSAKHCDDPLCPVCCYAWAKKSVKRIMARFEVFDLVYGVDFESRHITVSVPVHDYDKPFSFLRRQAIVFAESVGVVGGTVIFHPKRIRYDGAGWYFSPHFHVVGKVKGGLVDGNLVREIHNRSGYVLKNLEVRRSVVGTLFYQLSHAGVPSGHGHCVAWFGELAYNKKVHPELKELVLQNERDNKMLAQRKLLCPVCGAKMVHVCRVAKAPMFDYKRVEEAFVLDFVGNWVVVPDDFHPRKRKYSKSEDDAYADYEASCG